MEGRNRKGDKEEFSDMELNTVRFLEKNSVHLLEKFNVTAKKHSKYDNVFALHYSQLKSPMNNVIVQECRGLVVEITSITAKKNQQTKERKCKVIAYPYKKFFNYMVQWMDIKD